MRQHRLDRARHVDAVAPPHGLPVERRRRAARTPPRRRCGRTGAAPSPSRSTEIASSKSVALAGSIVKVGSAVRSRRGVGRSSIRAPRRPPGLALHGAREAAVRVRARRSSASTTSRATSGRPSERTTSRRAPRPRRAHDRAHQHEVADPQVPAPAQVDRHPAARARRTAPPPSTARAGQEPTRAGGSARTAAGIRRLHLVRARLRSGERRRARDRAPRRAACRGSSRARTSGRDALAVQVAARPACSSCRRPGRARRRWRGRRSARRRPCRRSCGPTTGAPRRSCRAAVTISDALAVPRSTSTTTGLRVDHVAGRLEDPLRPRAPLGRHDRAVRDERARHQHRLVQQAAAVRAQIEHEALCATALEAPQLASPAHRARRSMNDASSTTPSFRPPARRSSPSTTGTGSARAAPAARACAPLALRIVRRT